MPYLNTDIAIIGAGTAGSFMANLLHEAGFDCLLLEKSRGQGGRCSRRYIASDYSIDLGTPEFLIDQTVNPRLKAYVSAWIQKGYLSPWSYQASGFSQDSQTESIASLCATPSMNAWHKHIAHHVNILTNCKIDSLAKVDDHWQLFDESGQLISTAKNVIITCPADQSAALFKDHNIFSDDDNITANCLPQFVCAVGFTQQANIPADVYRGGHGILATAIRENSKPSRTLPSALKEVWLLHSSNDWAVKNSSLGHQQAAITLSDAFCQHFGISDEPDILTSHYWRLARHPIKDPSKSSFIWNKGLHIGCCGDWLSTGDIPGALNSALNLFENITSR